MKRFINNSYKPRFGGFRPPTLFAAILATQLLCLTGSAATNVLTNPGFEIGALSGWTTFFTGECSANCSGGAVESTNNTYYNGGEPGGSNVLTHSGNYVGKEYGQFTGAANTTGMYQESAAAQGSVWSSGGFALSHHEDFISGGNTFWLEVSFRDTGSNVLALYKSALVTSNVIPDTWTNLPVVNQIDLSDPALSLVTNTTAILRAPSGSSRVRYQVIFSQPAGFDAGSVYFDDLNLTKIAGSDPDITTAPVSQTKVEGQTVTFSVAVTGATTLSYQWKMGTKDLINGGNISGATSATLTISNLTMADAGDYSVEVSDNAGSLLSTPVRLTVITAAQASNILTNSGFESGIEFPWVRFNGGALHTTNDFYAGSSTPVSVFDGAYVSQTYGSSTYNGIFQDLTATNGQIFTADAWFLMAAEDPLSGSNTCWLEVQFRNAADAPLALYRSFIIDPNFPTSIWINLAVTNHYSLDFVTLLGPANYLVAPAGTAKVRYQVTYHALGGGGSIWYDDMDLFLKIPVTLTPLISNGNIRLSFATQIGVDYQILYKNRLTDTVWQTLTTVSGDGTVKTVTDPLGTGQRFYIVSTE